MQPSSLASLALVGLGALVAMAACGSNDNKAHTTGGASSSSTTTTGSTGGASSSSASTGGGTGGMGGAEVYPAPHPAAPTVLNQGGPTLTAPVIVPVFFANDDPAVVAKLQTFLTQVGPSDYWTQAGAAYGITAPTLLPAIQSADTPTGTIDDTDIVTWLSGKLNSDDPAFPKPVAGTVFTIFYPAGVSVTEGGGASCTGFLGYHESLTLDAAHGNQGVSYAVVVRCSSAIASLTQTTSHELFEAATDPFPTTTPAYEQLDDDHLLWELVVGAEVGDLCDVSPSFGTFTGIDEPVQRIWSNPEAAASHDPCVPHAAGQVYFAAVPVLTDDVVTDVLGTSAHTKVAAVDVGASKTIDVALFSDASTGGDWHVSVLDAKAAAGQSPLLSLALDKSTGTNGDTLHLTIKALAAGLYGYELFFVLSSNGKTTNAWLGVVSTTVSASACASAGSPTACYTCCENQDLAGAEFYGNAFDQYCACPSGAACNAACTTAGSNVCGTPAQQGSTACYDCLAGLGGTDPCATTTLAACQADTGCAAYLTCLEGCPTM
jgi:hypothetical protein